MMHRIRALVNRYIVTTASTEARELFYASAIKDIAVSMVGLFEPIYLYGLGFSVPALMGYYALVYGAYILLLPFGARIARRIGNEKAMAYSSPFLVLHYVALLLSAVFPICIALAAISVVIWKICYWPAYHTDFILTSDRRSEGRMVSNRVAISSIASAIAPMIGGVIASFAGFSWLFACSSLLIVCSNIPLLRTPEQFTPGWFPYRTSLGRLLKVQSWRSLIPFLGYGELIFSLTVWPLFIYLTVPDVLGVGLIISASRLVGVIFTLSAGRISDEGGRRSLLRSGSIWLSASWLVRPLISGGFGVFLIDSYYRVAQHLESVPFTALQYDHARNGDVMTRVVFFEMGKGIGVIFALLLALWVCVFFPLNPWPILFVIAGLLSLFYSLMPEPSRIVSRTEHTPH